MSDSNRVRLAYVKESSFGVQKTGANLQILRHTGESLKQTQQTTTSNEIRSDRQISGIKRNNVGADGDINFEFSFGTFDDLLLAVLMHNPTAVTVTAITISALAADNSFNDSANGFGGIAPGQFIQVTGFTGDPANNGFFKVESATAAKLIVSGGTLVNDTAGESVTIKQGDWSTVITVNAATISAASADNSFNDSGNGFGDLAVNQWIKVTGFTEAANNGYFKIIGKTAGKLVVTGGTLVTEAEGNAVTLKQGAVVFNGVSKTSFNIERTYEDLSHEIALFTGMMPEQLALNISVDQIITGGLSFIGKQETSLATSGGTGYTPATTTEAVNAVENITSIFENMNAMDASALSITLKNNLRAKQKIGALGAFEIGSGTVSITGNLTAYYNNKTLIDKYLNQTVTSFAFVVVDVAGNAYVFDMPGVKFSSGQRNGGALNSDVMAELAYTAFMGTLDKVSLRIAKFAA